jgi:hypothetical protein
MVSLLIINKVIPRPTHVLVVLTITYWGKPVSHAFIMGEIWLCEGGR